MSHSDPAKHNRRSFRLAGYDYASHGAYFVTIVAQGRARLFGKVVDGEIHLNDAGRMVWRWWEELGHKFSNCVPGMFVVMPNHVHGVVHIVDDNKFTEGEDFGVNDDEGENVGADLRVCPGSGDPVTHGNLGAHDLLGAHIGAPLPDPGAHDDLGAYDNSGAHDLLGAHIGAPLHDAGENVGADLRVCPGSGDLGAYDDSGAHTGAPLPEIVQWFKTMTTNEYIRGVKSYAWTPFIGKLWQRNYYEHIVRNEGALHTIEQYILDNPRRWATDDENPDRMIQERKLGR